MTLTARAGRPLSGTAAVPGDKSCSHRALILGGMAEGTTIIHGLLESDDVLHRLEEREAALAEKLSRLDSILHQEAADLPRLFLLEIEYLHSMLETEVKWVRSLIDDLRSGRIAWDEEWLRSFADAEEG